MAYDHDHFNLKLKLQRSRVIGHSKKDKLWIYQSSYPC